VTRHSGDAGIIVGGEMRSQSGRFLLSKSGEFLTAISHHKLFIRSDLKLVEAGESEYAASLKIRNLLKSFSS